MMLKILVVGGSLGLHSVDVILSGQSLGRDIYNVRDDIIDDDGHSDQASVSEFWRGGAKITVCMLLILSKFLFGTKECL